MTVQEKFDRYESILREWNKKINLVSPGTLGNIKTRHIADSAQLADILPNDAQIIDFGSGAGFPSVVLAIMGYNITAIESVGKKAQFLKLLKSELDLPNLTIYDDRVENYIKTLKKAGKNDIFITARAFAPLIKILDYVSGLKYRLFLLKGRQINDEILIAQTKHKFNYELIPSKTGDGFIAIISHEK